MLDICAEGSSMEVSPPIQFRIEWADSQGKSPLLGCRPILTFGVSSVSQPGVKTDVPPAIWAPTLASLVSGVAGLRVYRPQNPVDQLAVSRGILEDVPSRERSDQILLRKHHQALPAEAPGHPHIPLPLRTWKQPPFESILETFLGINKRSQRLLHPVLRHNLLPVPHAIVQIEV